MDNHLFNSCILKVNSAIKLVNGAYCICMPRVLYEVQAKSLYRLLIQLDNELQKAIICVKKELIKYEKNEVK